MTTNGINALPLLLGDAPSGAVSACAAAVKTRRGDPGGHGSTPVFPELHAKWTSSVKRE
jgi:hypothetical protein